MKTAVIDTPVLRDGDVIEKILAGETAMFEILIRRFNDVLYKIGRMYGYNHHDTQDIMQDTHVAAFTQLSAFEGRSSYKTWISRIMIHKCQYKLKYGYFKNEIPIEMVPELNEAVPQTERKLLNRELSSVLEKSLENIPQIYRTVFVLREVEGFSVAETSEILGISWINVKVRLNRAKALLQKQVEQFYSEIEIYSFNRVYCDEVVKETLERINLLS
ncbi:MAG: sigma-70 family RNA polymerase sigma factor [Chitinophagaceae bacterium]|nr:sigma-70 family RNA polymerase sigma factor [Chitinophagaceae bacterium]